MYFLGEIEESRFHLAMTRPNSMILSFSFIASVALILGGRTCSCLQFNYPSFDMTNKDDFSFSPGSAIANGSLQVVVPNTGDLNQRSGRVVYTKETLKLWNRKQGVPTSFRTQFTLNILPQDESHETGEGMAFILTNNPSLPRNSSGQWLGICNNKTDGAPMNRIVAVEFDTRKSYEADLDGNHVGLDLNSIKSANQYPLSNLSIILSSGFDVLVSITYNSTTPAFILSVIGHGGHNLRESWPVDLSQHLLHENEIHLGFAGSTGDYTQLSQIKSWNFTTVEEVVVETRHETRNVFVCLVTLVSFTTCSILVLFVWRRVTRQRRLAYQALEKRIDAHGPVRFKLKELKHATGNFSPRRKLGRGGGGTVYHGYLSRIRREVAVKRVSANDKSRRGEKEFVAEVNTISKLSHRNLVKLMGWCHEGGELLLVYDYFPLGSLDKLLFANCRATALSPGTPELTWDRRFRIICGVASALDYLHHGSSRRILHRDVKAGNVMLDEEYNARLGDFGLARAIQLEGVTHHSTQAVAGTRGYMAHESFFTGRASLDTDVYAFGVFVMEVISGKSPSRSMLYDRQEMYIVDWFWRHYSLGKVVETADAELGGVYDDEQVDAAVRLALACCHPNPRHRPSMKKAVQVLIGGAPAPIPPLERPAFVWPLSGTQQEIELAQVGLLFTGGQPSFCSITSTSFTGR
jgi:interleukin-1 receptor-associated kinase 1